MRASPGNYNRQKVPILLVDLGPHPIHVFRRPTRVHSPDGISVGSAGLAQLPLRQTDRQTDRQTATVALGRIYALCVRDAA